MRTAVRSAPPVRRAAPAVAVGALACGLWLLTGVSPAQVAVFVLYEVAFVFGPGVFVYRALAGRSASGLRLVAVGWALGYLLEILAFVLSSATGVGALALLSPAAGLVGALVGGLRAPAAPRGRRATRATAPPAWRWALAGLCAIALAYVGAAYFSQAPLPDQRQAMTYNVDLLYDLALAGEVKHRWPLSEPLVAGRPFAYHTFPYFDLAAVSAATGLDLPLVLFRLYLPPMVVLLVLQLAWAGASFAGDRRAGLLAPAVALGLGELDLDLDRPWLYANYLGSAIWGPFNHGFLLGAVFFLPAIVLLHERLDSSASRRPPPGTGRPHAGTGSAPRHGERGGWLVVALLLLGCAGAKGIALLPLLVGALALWLGWWALTRRSLNRPAIVVALGITCLLAATYLIQYRAQGRGTQLDPLSIPMGMVAARPLEQALPDWLLLVVGSFGSLAAVWIGVALAIRDDRSSSRVWLLSLLLAGLAPLFLVFQPGDSHLWPLAYGGLAGSLLAGQGLTLLWDRWLRERWSARALAIGGGLWLAALMLAVAASKLTGFGPSELQASAVAHAALAGGLVALVVLWLSRGATARRLAATVLAALALATALDLPLDTLPELARRIRDQPRGELPPGLLEGLGWVQRNTPSAAVLAVQSPQLANASQTANHAHFSAFAQRRVMLEGWVTTGNPDTIARRVQLNRAIFERADRAALRTAVRDYGVTHLVVDKRAGASPGLVRLAPLVLSSAALDVYAVVPSRLNARR